MSKKFHKRDLVAYLKIAVLVILQNLTRKLFNCSLYNENDVIWSICRTFKDFECNVVIKMLLSTHLLLRLGLSLKKTNDQLLGWFAATVVLTESKLSELCCCPVMCVFPRNWFVNGKRNFSIQEISLFIANQNEIYIDSELRPCGLSVHWS